MAELNANLILQGEQQGQAAYEGGQQEVSSQIQNAQQIAANQFQMANNQRNLKDSERLTTAYNSLPANATSDQISTAFKSTGASAGAQLDLQSNILNAQVGDLKKKQAIQDLAEQQLKLSSDKQSLLDDHLNKFGFYGDSILTGYNQAVSKNPNDPQAAGVAATRVQQMFGEEAKEAKQQLDSGLITPDLYKMELGQIQTGISSILGTGMKVNPQDGSISGNAKFNPQAMNTLLMSNQQLQAAKKALLDQRKNQAETDEAEARAKALRDGKLVPVVDPNNPNGPPIYVPSSEAGGRQVGAKPGGGYGYTGGPMDPKTLNYTSAGYATGLLPIGVRDPNLGAIRKNLAAHGITPMDMASAKAQVKELNSEASSVGRRAGNISILEKSVGGAGDQVLSTLSKVDRTGLTAVNKAIAAGKTEFSNPAEAAYAAAITSFINEYGRVVAGGTGNTSDAARNEGHEALNKAMGPDAVKAVIQQLAHKELDIVSNASDQAVEALGHSNKYGAILKLQERLGIPLDNTFSGDVPAADDSAPAPSSAAPSSPSPAPSKPTVSNW